MAGKNLHFSLSHVTEGEVRKAIKRLKPKKSSGPDFIPPTIIKLAIDVITTPLTWVIHGGPASIFLDSRSFASPCKNHLPVDLPVRFLVAGRQGY